MKQVEFILCLSDNTWRTEIWDVDEQIVDGDGDITLEEWANKELNRRADKSDRYNDVVFIGVYCENCEEFSDEMTDKG